MTARGRLTQASNQLLSQIIDPNARWVPRYVPDAHDYVLNGLLDVAVQLGLVRVAGRRLELRKRGRKGVADPLALWQHLAAALPFERDEYGRGVARYLLILTASGLLTTEIEALPVVDRLVLATGWNFDQRPGEALGSRYAASTTLAVLRMASSATEVGHDAVDRTSSSLGSAGAILLASSVLANDRLFFT
ncbi:hypothetical protein [Subtercola boreus]|uniref:Uncharacterized protein n=1 Tax=Subtercola boreus TaxID=120213 RepID=A0A3E0WDQ7_9MICO|nr:hypothetical protein [Subtercola boreus]RFA22411.1 hypothetical protein B7R24_04510 [Subtercola boreus]RFA22473.1 hypothetical protein B7R23_04505 [Subtercola boreus]RFA28488.1 hypothetical protein B7R25_04520 [Subtercola boreus]